MERAYSGQITKTQVNVINQAFIWMCVGLAASTVSSLFVATSPGLLKLIYGNMIVFYGLIIGELALVFFLNLRISKMSFGAALMGFLAYSVLNGATISAIFLIYTGVSIITTFGAAAALFGAMAVYGYSTQRDLTKIGNLAIMALIGVIIASVVNIFLKSDSFSYILSYIAIAVFVALTAYDTQKLKQMSSMSGSTNLGILGALMLYLDFINIFLNLLRILGRRRD